MCIFLPVSELIKGVGLGPWALDPSPRARAHGLKYWTYFNILQILKNTLFNISRNIANIEIIETFNISVEILKYWNYWNYWLLFTLLNILNIFKILKYIEYSITCAIFWSCQFNNFGVDQYIEIIEYVACKLNILKYIECQHSSIFCCNIEILNLLNSIYSKYCYKYWIV